MSMNRERSLSKGFTGCILVFFIVMMMSMTASAASDVKLNKSSASLVVGKTIQLSVENVGQTVKWSSSKKGIAMVSSSGLVTAKKAGTAIITAKVGSQKLTCRVTVEANVWNHPSGNNILSWKHSSWQTLDTCDSTQQASVYAQPLQISYNNEGQLTAKFVILNMTPGTSYELNQISVVIRETDGTVIAKGTFHCKNTVTIKPYARKTYDLTFNDGATKEVINLNTAEIQWTIRTN